MKYKKTYTPEEIQELVDWITQQLPHMPESLYINEALFIPDLKTTARYYIDIAVKLHNNPTYGAQVHHLFDIRQRLEEMQQNNPSNEAL